ncbi:VanZ family protein [Yoonia sp.]|uniref:VanZ family protein n=1 Tax=Yoonia sp. TaxID=2212373 RepID=UPI003918C173
MTETAAILIRVHSVAVWAVQPRVAFGLTLLLAVIVAVATLTPSDILPSAPGSDKLHHFLAFGAIAFPAALAKPRAALWIVLGVSAYGVAIEIMQTNVGRHGDVKDALANTLGAMCGTALGAAMRVVILRDWRNRT